MKLTTPDPHQLPQSPSRFWLWVYGNRNLWGSVAGLFGMGLFFSGVIGPGWLLIVAGLYAIAALAAPTPKAQTFTLEARYTLADAQAHLDRMLAALKPAVEAKTYAQLQSLCEHALTLFPKQDSMALTDEDRYTLRETLARYLPETLANYLKLPPLYRRYHAVRDGKSAEALLSEQLATLDVGLRDMMDRVFRAEAQDMLTQGRFLEDKFKRPDLLQALNSNLKAGDKVR